MNHYWSDNIHNHPIYTQTGVIRGLALALLPIVVPSRLTVLALLRVNVEVRLIMRATGTFISDWKRFLFRTVLRVWDFLHFLVCLLPIVLQSSYIENQIITISWCEEGTIHAHIQPFNVYSWGLAFLNARKWGSIKKVIFLTRIAYTFD